MTATDRGRSTWSAPAARETTERASVTAGLERSVVSTPVSALWEDRRWAILLTVLVLALTLVPPTAARLFGPTDRVQVGAYWYHEDFTVYLAAMREAATTPSWLIHDHFTTEPHGPIMMFPLYVLIGKISAFMGLPLLAVYAAVELAARCALALTLYAFVAALTLSGTARRFGFVFAVFSAGLGFWTALLHSLSAAPGDSSARLINLYVEATTFGAFLTAPHITLGLTSILAGLLAFAAATRGSWAGLVALAGCVLIVGFVHPFNTPVLLASFGAYVAARTVMERRVPWSAVRATILAGAVGSPIVLYNYVAFTFAPVWSQTFGSQNLLPSPLPWELLLDYGVVLFLAPFGIVALRGRTTIEQRVILAFLVVVAVCIYLPVPYQRRFAFGAQPALAGLAAAGWPLVVAGTARLVAKLGATATSSRVIATKALGYSLIPLGFTTVLTAYFVVISSAVHNQPLAMYTVDRDTYSIGQWIGEHSGPDDVVLGSLATGAALGGLVPGHVYVGHTGVTIRPAEKKAALAALYRGDLSLDEARAFLESNGVSYVVVGPEERKLGDWDPGIELGLPVARQMGEAIAYRTDIVR